MEITEVQRESIRRRIGKLTPDQMAYVIGYILRGNEEILLEALAGAER